MMNPNSNTSVCMDTLTFWTISLQGKVFTAILSTLRLPKCSGLDYKHFFKALFFFHAITNSFAAFDVMWYMAPYAKLPRTGMALSGNTVWRYLAKKYTSCRWGNKFWDFTLQNWKQKLEWRDEVISMKPNNYMTGKHISLTGPMSRVRDEVEFISLNFRCL